MNVFVAGGSGTIGVPLVRPLRQMIAQSSSRIHTTHVSHAQVSGHD